MRPLPKKNAVTAANCINADKTNVPQEDEKTELNQFTESTQRVRNNRKAKGRCRIASPDDAPIPLYRPQVIILWVIALLLPVYFILLLTDTITLISIYSACFAGVYLLLIILLICINMDR